MGHGAEVRRERKFVLEWNVISRWIFRTSNLGRWFEVDVTACMCHHPSVVVVRVRSMYVRKNILWEIKSFFDFILYKVYTHNHNQNIHKILWLLSSNFLILCNNKKIAGLLWFFFLHVCNWREQHEAMQDVLASGLDHCW